jgi:hypothetical protein
MHHPSTSFLEIHHCRQQYLVSVLQLTNGQRSQSAALPIPRTALPIQIPVYDSLAAPDDRDSLAATCDAVGI